MGVVSQFEIYFFFPLFIINKITTTIAIAIKATPIGGLL